MDEVVAIPPELAPLFQALGLSAPHMKRGTQVLVLRAILDASKRVPDPDSGQAIS